MAVWAVRKDGAILWVAGSGLISHHKSVSVLVPITYAHKYYPGLDCHESTGLVFVYAGTTLPVVTTTTDHYKQLCAQADIGDMQ